jgi:hypothetical protein
VEADLLDILGPVVAPDALATPHARELVRAVTSGSLLFARLVEVRKGGRDESVVLELDVECPQRPRHDIRPVERVAVQCDPDADLPEVLALRPDFPLVPHTNLRPWRYPRSLCLYDRPWAEVKLSWTPVGFVERIRWWLAQTARGTLHGGDQPLEPLLLPTAEPIIFPSDLLDDPTGSGSGYFNVIRVGSGGALVVRRTPSGGRNGAPAAPPTLIATVLRAAPSLHGVIRWTPPTLAALSAMLAPAGLGIEAELRARLTVWIRNHGLHRCGVVLVLLLPKRRTAAGPVESVESLAVECADNLLSLAVKLGVVRNNAKRTREMAKAIGMKDAIPRPGEDVNVSLSRVALALSRTQASRLSGLPLRDERRYVAIGVGALGSQTVTNLVRSGSGEWTLVDSDTLLPHNLTRHALSGWELGMPKAEALAKVLNATIDGPPIATAIVVDILSPRDRAERVQRSLAEAHVILDMSASQPVARHLAIEATSSARRVSLFLNPTGTSLVLLAEDAARSVTLDALEMQYYREVIRRPELATHLRREEGGVRYAQSCRDVSSKLPTHLVALHAAIGSEAAVAASAEKTPPGLRHPPARPLRAAPRPLPRRLAGRPAARRDHPLRPWPVQRGQPARGLASVPPTRCARVRPPTVHSRPRRPDEDGTGCRRSGLGRAARRGIDAEPAPRQAGADRGWPAADRVLAEPEPLPCRIEASWRDRADPRGVQHPLSRRPGTARTGTRCRDVLLPH